MYRLDLSVGKRTNMQLSGTSDRKWAATTGWLRLLSFSVLFGAMLIVAGMGIAQAANETSRWSEDRVTPPDFNVLSDLVLVMPVEDKLPCSLSDRCHSGSCMGALAQPAVPKLPNPDRSNQIQLCVFGQSGSNLPPPIGPPRVIS